MTAQGGAERGPHTSPAEWLAREPRAVSRADVLAHFTRHALDRDIRLGLVTHILPDTYVGSAHRNAFATRATAALVWAGPAAALGGTSAAFAHRLVAEEPPTVTLCVPRTTRLRGPEWIRVIQPSVDMARAHAGGLRVVPPLDAVIQAWSELGTGRGTALILNAVRRERITANALRVRASAYPRIRARRALIALLDPLDDGAESYLEHLAATRVFNTAEFRAFHRQHPVRAGGRTYVLDMYDDSARVAVELDGRAFHGEDASRRRDLERDADLASLGITTIRLTFEDVTGRPEWCRSRVRAALAARRRPRAA